MAENRECRVELTAAYFPRLDEVGAKMQTMILGKRFGARADMLAYETTGVAVPGIDAAVTRVRFSVRGSRRQLNELVKYLGGGNAAAEDAMRGKIEEV